MHGQDVEIRAVSVNHHKGTKDTKRSDELSNLIIGAAIEVHNCLGPGLLESAFEECLCRELRLQGISFERQKSLAVTCKGVALDSGYKLDVVVENLVILELKAVERLTPIHEAQLITYLKLSNKKVGLLINFNVLHLRDGITRRVN